MSHQKYELIDHCTPYGQSDMPWDSWSWDRCSSSFSFRATCMRTISNVPRNVGACVSIQSKAPRNCHTVTTAIACCLQSDATSTRVGLPCLRKAGDITVPVNGRNGRAKRPKACELRNANL